MVGGRAVTGSQYRRYHRLEVQVGLPDSVVRFAEETAEVYSPAEVFVIDVAQSGDSLFVVEYNCFNSSGFYGSGDGICRMCPPGRGGAAGDGEGSGHEPAAVDMATTRAPATARPLPRVPAGDGRVRSG